jgi:hypothetical protein
MFCLLCAGTFDGPYYEWFSTEKAKVTAPLQQIPKQAALQQQRQQQRHAMLSAPWLTHMVVLGLSAW